MAGEIPENRNIDDQEIGENKGFDIRNLSLIEHAMIGSSYPLEINEKTELVSNSNIRNWFFDNPDLFLKPINFLDAKLPLEEINKEREKQKSLGNISLTLFEFDNFYENEVFSSEMHIPNLILENLDSTGVLKGFRVYFSNRERNKEVLGEDFYKQLKVASQLKDIIELDRTEDGVMYFRIKTVLS